MENNEFIINKKTMFLTCPFCSKHSLAINKSNRNRFYCFECNNQIYILNANGVKEDE